MTDADQPKKSSPLKWLLLAFLGCGCLCFAFMAAAVGIPFLVTQPAVDAAHAHFRDAGADPAAAYDGLAKPFQDATPRAAFVEFVEARPYVYKGADITFTNRNYQNGIVTLTGTATAAGGGSQAPVKIQLAKDGETWKVLNVDLTGN